MQVCHIHVARVLNRMFRVTPSLLHLLEEKDVCVLHSLVDAGSEYHTL